MHHADCFFFIRKLFCFVIENSAKSVVVVVVSGETDCYAEFPGTLSSFDKVFCSICAILDNVIKQNIQLRLLSAQSQEQE